jgi:carbohydrate-selective porin OprB
MSKANSRTRQIGCAVTAAALLLCPAISRADESGISFWLPGQYGSLAAVPQTPDIFSRSAACRDFSI